MIFSFPSKVSSKKKAFWGHSWRSEGIQQYPRGPTSGQAPRTESEAEHHTIGPQLIHENYTNRDAAGVKEEKS